MVASGRPETHVVPVRCSSALLAPVRAHAAAFSFPPLSLSFSLRLVPCAPRLRAFFSPLRANALLPVAFRCRSPAVVLRSLCGRRLFPPVPTPPSSPHVDARAPVRPTPFSLAPLFLVFPWSPFSPCAPVCKQAARFDRVLDARRSASAEKSRRSKPNDSAVAARTALPSSSPSSPLPPITCAAPAVSPRSRPRRARRRARPRVGTRPFRLAVLAERHSRFSRRVADL